LLRCLWTVRRYCFVTPLLGGAFGGPELEHGEGGLAADAQPLAVPLPASIESPSAVLAESLRCAGDAGHLYLRGGLFTPAICCNAYFTDFTNPNAIT
jgi:hypothetical protein